MNFSIEQRELSTLTNLVYRAASNKNAIPVLAGLLLTVDPENGLTITATDMEIGMRVSTKKVDIIEPGAVLVNAFNFNNFVKSLKEPRINLQYDKETSKLNLVYGKSTFFLNTYRDYEYPNLPIDRMEDRFTIPQASLKEALKKTAFAAAVTHFRQVFTGILFDIKSSGQLKVVASDTHRLAYFNYEMEQSVKEDFKFIIPQRTANELLRVLEDSDEPFKVAFNENNVVFHRDGFLLMSRLIEGQYPVYEQVIPAAFSTFINIKTHILGEILERARIMPGDESLKMQYIQLTVANNELKVNAYSEAMGELDERVEEVSIEGDQDQKISFNTNYFLDAVRALQSETEDLQIKLSGALGPAMIKNPTDEKYIYILVPLRTS